MDKPAIMCWRNTKVVRVLHSAWQIDGYEYLIDLVFQLWPIRWTAVIQLLCVVPDSPGIDGTISPLARFG